MEKRYIKLEMEVTRYEVEDAYRTSGQGACLDGIPICLDGTPICLDQ